MTAIPHDQRIALCNSLMREQIKPRLPEGEGACLIVFDGSGDPRGLLCYIGTHERAGMRNTLSKLLTKWDVEMQGKAYTSTDIPNGMLAYRAWRDRILRSIPSDSPESLRWRREWDDLGPVEREAWEQAAVAVRL